MKEQLLAELEQHYPKDKYKQYKHWHTNCLLVTCKKNFGARGVNWVAKGKQYLARGLSKGFAGDDKIYISVFSSHPIMCGGKQYGIVAFCRVPIDRFTFSEEDQIKINEAIANANTL